MMQHSCNNYCKNFINYSTEQTDFPASCTMLHNVLYLGFTCDKNNAILHEDNSEIIHLEIKMTPE